MLKFIPIQQTNTKLVQTYNLKGKNKTKISFEEKYKNFHGYD